MHQRREGILLICVAAALAIGLVADRPAHARPSAKKGIWGPVTVDGRSQFPIYRELGVGVFSLRLPWDGVAQVKPARPRDPRDPAYQWPAELDQAIKLATNAGIRVAVDIRNAPGWANGGHPPNWVPRRIADWRNFVTAAVRRYPGVDYWVIWAEPTRQANFMPLVFQDAPTVPLNARQRRPVQFYARLLDAAYGAIHRRRPRAKVVGGNSFVTGDVSPLNWIRALKLPSGRVPRMDLYGHHPFTARRPDLSRPLIRPGLADYSDLDTLTQWIDFHLGRGPRGRPIKLFLGEFSIPSDHQSRVFGPWVSRATQATWIRSALRIARRWKRIETMVWLGLYDEPPAADGLEVNWGLLDWRGRRKPAFRAYKNG